MSGVAITRALLVANSALIAQVPSARIFSGVVPQATVLPAISVMEVVSTEVPTIDATAPTTIVDSRVQVTVIASTYPNAKTVHALARKACNYQRGTLAGYSVISVRRVNNGPDFTDPEAQICIQSIDFSVLYHEPNT